MSQQVGAVQRLDKSRSTVDVRKQIFPVGGDMRVRKAIRAKVPAVAVTPASLTEITGSGAGPVMTAFVPPPEVVLTA